MSDSQTIRLLGGPGHGQEMTIPAGPAPVLYADDRGYAIGSTVYTRYRLRFPIKEREGWVPMEPSPDDLIRHSSERLYWCERDYWSTPGYKELVDSICARINHTVLAWGPDAWLRLLHSGLPEGAMCGIEAAFAELDRVLTGEE